LRASLRSFARSVDTEAVMQETLLRIWQVAPRCRPDGRPNSLLRLSLKIARNLALSETRRGRAGARGPLTGSEGEEPAEPPAPDPALPDPFLRKRITECRGKLPRKPAAALDARLRAGGARPDRDLAAALGMKLNTFLQNVTRARRLLAEWLRRLGIEVA
jgi:RNA polymerase sigma-70 factor (ECF subfamily)